MLLFLWLRFNDYFTGNQNEINTKFNINLLNQT